MKIILRLKVTMIQIMAEKHCFGYFGRFMTRDLTLRTRSTYIQVFKTLFGFCSFYATSCQFQKLGLKSLPSAINFAQSRHFFGIQMDQFAAVEQTGTAKLLAFFQRFQSKEHVLRVNKSNLLMKTLLMEIILQLKVIMIQIITQKYCFGYFGIFVTRGLTLRPRSTYIYVFQTFFGFCSFYATFCQFWKLAVNSLHSTLKFPSKQVFVKQIFF